MPLTDTAILLRTRNDEEVLAQRFEVMWPDGSFVHLHLVRQYGLPATYLRAVRHPIGHFVLFDVRSVVRQLGPDIAAAPERDAPGLVFYALRGALPNAEAFLDTVAAQRPPSRAQQRPMPQPVPQRTPHTEGLPA